MAFENAEETLFAPSPFSLLSFFLKRLPTVHSTDMEGRKVANGSKSTISLGRINSFAKETSLHQYFCFLEEVRNVYRLGSFF